MNTASAVLIAGPTASGKSALAMALAERVGGVIINADSMQVYRELRVLTARPPVEDEHRLPHRLFGHIGASEAYSAGQYATEARRVIAEVRALGRVPIIVGGTGLYFKVLLEGLSPIPVIPPVIRAHWRSQADRSGAAHLHSILTSRDPEMAGRLLATDTQRIVRALEVFDATGRSLAEWQKSPGEPVLKESETLRLVVAPDRDELYRRCNARFEAMVSGGALNEAAAMVSLALAPSLPAMRALGLRPLMQLVRGQTTETAAVEAAKTETRHYARRQLTWLKRYMIAWKWLSKQEIERNEASLVPFID